MTLKQWAEKTIEWLDRQAECSELGERQTRGRFDALADSHAADARRYRAMAKHGRKALEEDKT